MVTPVEAGKVYTVQTVEGKLVQVVFCHNDEEGQFQDGITSEDLIAILVDRHRGFMEKTHTTENLNTYTFLKQAQACMHLRRTKKYARKHRK